MTVKELIQKARKLHLENVEILDRYSVEEIPGGSARVPEHAPPDASGRGVDPRS